MKTVRIPNGFLHLNESLADCHFCAKKVRLSKIEKMFNETDKSHIKYKCKCGATFGITTDYKGDYVSFNLK